ncbi:hypothetical protein FB446DRAFT_724330 [Lentinula raphanica]|nr:hypothetical protein FB446DRAFT_724330 [Lentinula raphanica]
MALLVFSKAISQPTFDSWNQTFYMKKTTNIAQKEWETWDSERKLTNEIFLVEHLTDSLAEKTGSVCLLFDSNTYCSKLEMEMRNFKMMDGDPTRIGNATFANKKSKDDFHTFANARRQQIQYRTKGWVQEFMQTPALEGVVWEQAKTRNYLVDWVYLHQLMTDLFQKGIITEATFGVWQGEMTRRVKDLEDFKKEKRVKNKNAYAKSSRART